MKILLDENLPHRLRSHLGVHEVVTVRHQGWSGLKNGDLLHAAEIGGFDVFVTGDQSIRFEQHLAGRQIGVVVLSAVEWPILSQHLPSICAAVGAASQGSYQTVECGNFTRKRERAR